MILIDTKSIIGGKKEYETSYKKKEIRSYGAIELKGCNIYTYENAISAICAHNADYAPLPEQVRTIVSKLIADKSYNKATYHSEMYSCGAYGCTGRVDRIEFMDDKWNVIDTCEVKFIQ